MSTSVSNVAIILEPRNIPSSEDIECTPESQNGQPKAQIINMELEFRRREVDQGKEFVQARH